MRRVLCCVAAVIMLGVESGASSDCSVEDVHFYEKTESSGDPVVVYTRYCTYFTIRNTSDGSRFDPRVEASFADGTRDAVKVKTPRMEPGAGYGADLCFGTVRIRELSCSW